jgi:hypothetical protein
MSLAITHFALGMLVGLLIYQIGGKPSPLLYAYVFGVLALGPDLAKIIPHAAVLEENALIATLFVGHHVLDVVDTTDSILLGAILLGLCGVAVVAVQFR